MSTADLREELNAYTSLPPLGRNYRGIEINDTQIQPGDVIENTRGDPTYKLVIDHNGDDIICYNPGTRRYTNYLREWLARDLHEDDVIHHQRVIR